MHQYELRILSQKEDYNTPYQVVRGFNTSWWHRRDGRIDATIRDSKEYLQFLVNGTEVGRAEVIDCKLGADYDGIDKPITTKEITFFEIRDDVRRCGYGTAFAQCIITRYAGTPVIAFSEDADLFWSGIGWVYFRRKDGEGWPYWRSLFASLAISN